MANKKDGSKKPTRKKQPGKRLQTQSKKGVDREAKKKEPNSSQPSNVRRPERHNIPKKKTPLTEYQKAHSFKQIEKIVKSKKRLRYKGRFISNDAQRKVLEFAKILDKEKIKYSLHEIMQNPDLERAVIITEDITPKELFYWNVQTLIEKNSFGRNMEIKIHDFDGSVLYQGKSEIKAAEALQKVNRKIDNLRKVLEIQDLDNSGFTVPIYETRRDGDTVKLRVDLQGIKSKIPETVWSKYKQSL